MNILMYQPIKLEPVAVLYKEGGPWVDYIAFLKDYKEHGIKPVAVKFSNNWVFDIVSGWREYV